MVGAAEGVQNTIALFETRLEAAQGYLASGDITAAWGEIESALLIGLENVGMPLLSPLAIPGDMIQNLADVYDSLVTRGTSVAITRGLLAPPITASFALANVAEVAVKKLQIGDYEGALTAVVNGPAIVTGAFLNGYKPALTYDDEGNPLTYATESFQGVLTPRHPNPTDPAGTPNGQGGSIDQFFVTLPRAIATALKPTTTTAAAATASGSSAKLVSVDVVEEAPAADTTTTTEEVKEVTDDAATTTSTTKTKKSSFAEKAAERAEARAKKAKDTRDNLTAAVRNVSDNIKKAVSGGKTGDKESTSSTSESSDSDSGSGSE